jgi:hypothetical protein
MIFFLAVPGGCGVPGGFVCLDERARDMAWWRFCWRDGVIVSFDFAAIVGG